MPRKIPDPPSEWAATYRALAGDLRLRADTLERATDELRGFWGLANSHKET